MFRNKNDKLLTSIRFGSISSLLHNVTLVSVIDEFRGLDLVRFSLSIGNSEWAIETNEFRVLNPVGFSVSIDTSVRAIATVEFCVLDLVRRLLSIGISERAIATGFCVIDLVPFSIGIAECVVAADEFLCLDLIFD